MGLLWKPAAVLWERSGVVDSGCARGKGGEGARGSRGAGTDPGGRAQFGTS